MGLRLQIIAATVLSTIREREAVFGKTISQLYRSPHALLGTPARRHKITDRHQRKLAARYREHANVEFQRRTGEPCSNYELAIGDWRV